MAEGFEIRERTMSEKLHWYASFIEDAKSRQEIVAAAVQLPSLLRDAADKIDSLTGLINE